VASCPDPRPGAKAGVQAWQIEGTLDHHGVERTAYELVHQAEVEELDVLGQKATPEGLEVGIVFEHVRAAEQGVRQGIDGGDQIRRWALVHRAIMTEDRSGPT